MADETKLALEYSGARGRGLAGPPGGRAADPPLATSADHVDRTATAATTDRSVHAVATNPETGDCRTTRERYILARTPVGAALLLGARGV